MELLVQSPSTTFGNYVANSAKCSQMLPHRYFRITEPTLQIDLLREWGTRSQVGRYDDKNPEHADRPRVWPTAPTYDPLDLVLIVRHR